MNDPLKDWEDLQSEWQAYQPDIQQIKKKINWVTWRMGAILAVDVLVVLTYIPFLIYLTGKPDNNWMINSWHYFMGLILIYGVYFDFKIRLPLMRSQGESTREVLEFYLKRTKAGITVGRVGKNFSLFLLASFIVWWSLNHFLGVDTKAARWQLGAFGTMWITLFIFICGWYEKRKQKEFEKLNALWKEYIE